MLNRHKAESRCPQLIQNIPKRIAIMLNRRKAQFRRF
jgi:hypothetical protein